MNERWKDELFDAVRSAQWTGASFRDLISEAKLCWIEALRQEIQSVEKAKLP